MAELEKVRTGIDAVIARALSDNRIVGTVVLFAGPEAGMMRHEPILWRRLDQPGHDSARLIEDPNGPYVEGTAVFREAGRPCRLDYRVVCDGDWQTVAARVSGWFGAERIELEVAANAARVWALNGRECPEVQGCYDVDLAFTPATNLLPIRRERLAIGSKAAVRSAWLNFPNLTLEILDQTYERVTLTRYHYTSNGGSFEVMLDTNAAGLITNYPTLWQLEAGP